MTQNKKFKQRVRARMAETGESYTQALARIRAEAPAPPVVAPTTYSALAAHRHGIYAERNNLTFEAAVRAAVELQAACPWNKTWVENTTKMLNETDDGLTDDEREAVEDAIAPHRKPGG